MKPKTRERLEATQAILSSFKVKVALLIVQIGFAAAAFWNGNAILGALFALLVAFDLLKIMG